MSALTRSQGPPAWLRVVCSLAALGCLWGVLGNLARVAGPDRWTALGGAAVSLGGLLLDVAVVVTRFSASVTNTELRLSFPPFYRKVVPLRTIVDVGEVRTYSAVECGGVGVRLDGRGRVCLLWSPGEGFAVTTTDGREYRIILPGAAELAERLRLALRAGGRE